MISKTNPCWIMAGWDNTTWAWFPDGTLIPVRDWQEGQ